MTNANKFNLLLDVAKLMHSLADGLEAVAYAFADSQELFVDATAVQSKVETGQPTPKAIAEKMPALEDVRAVLAVKSQNGMTAEVKGLISKYGGSKLSDIDPNHYGGQNRYDCNQVHQPIRTKYTGLPKIHQAA